MVGVPESDDGCALVQGDRAGRCNAQKRTEGGDGAGSTHFEVRRLDELVLSSGKS